MDRETPKDSARSSFKENNPKIEGQIRTYGDLITNYDDILRKKTHSERIEATIHEIRNNLHPARRRQIEAKLNGLEGRALDDHISQKEAFFRELFGQFKKKTDHANSTPPSEITVGSQSLPLSCLVLVSSAPYFLLAAKFEILDPVGLHDMNVWGKLAGFLVTICLALFGYACAAQDGWNDDWRKVFVRYSFFVFIGLFLIGYINSLGGGYGGGECVPVGRYGEEVCY